MEFVGIEWNFRFPESLMYREYNSTKEAQGFVNEMVDAVDIEPLVVVDAHS